MSDEINDTAYDGWAIVELMGHRVIAGRVSEASQYGAAQLRIDVPGPDGRLALTQYYGGAAIYALTPCDEAAALRVLRNRHALPEPARLALPPLETVEMDPDGNGDD